MKDLKVYGTPGHLPGIELNQNEGLESNPVDRGITGLLALTRTIFSRALGHFTGDHTRKHMVR